MKIKITLRIAIFCLFFSNVALSQIISNEAFIKGNFVEVGVNSSGAYGTDGDAPLPYHPRVFLGGSQRNLGFVADPDQNGWAIGVPDYFGDFFYPGQRQEGFSLQMNGTVYHNWTSLATAQIPGAQVSIVNDGVNITEIWQGSINGLSVKQSTIVPINDVYFVIRVELQNTTTLPMTGVYYLRTLDPDNDQTLSGNFTTTNNITFKLPNVNNNTLVSALGTVYTNCYLGLGTRDCRAKPFIINNGLLTPTESDLISNIYNETDTGYLYTGMNVADTGVGISFSVGNIAPGETKKFAMAYILNQADLELALSQTSPVVEFNDSQVLVDGSTYSFCEGEIVNMTITNGEENTWHWEPEEFFSNPFGPNVDLTILDVATTFTVTGESDCSPVTYTFTITPTVFQSSLTAANAAICTGNSATYNPLAGVTSPTSTINWYDSPAGITPISTSPSFTTPVYTNTTSTPVVYTFYYEETNVNTCISELYPFTVTVYNNLDLPNEELKVCSTGATSGTFNLTEIENLSNATYTYYSSMANFASGTPISNTTNFTTSSTNQIVYVNIVLSSGCSDLIQLELQVFNEIVVAPGLLNGCDNDFDEEVEFDLTDANSSINSAPDSQFAYFLSQSSAENNENPITDFTTYTNLSNPQTIYVRVFNDNCFEVTTLELNVYELPMLSPGTLSSCVENADGSANFDLTSANPQFNSSDATLGYTFYTSMANLTAGIAITTPTNYQNTSNPQTIYVNGINSTGCSAITQLQLNTTGLPTTINVVQPSCISAVGSITVTSPLGSNFEYSISNGLTYQLSPVFSNLTPNTYNVVVKDNSTGCISVAIPVVINPTPVLAPPTLNPITQPTCIVTTGTVTIASPLGANFEYSLDGILFQSSPTFSGLISNNYSVVVRDNAIGCVSTATPFTINPIPTVNAPTIGTVTQTTCTTPSGMVVISSPVGSNFEYSFDSVIFQSSNTFSGLAPNNTYDFVVRNITNGCISPSTSVAIDDIPTQSAPEASVTVQPSCEVVTGTIVFTSPIGSNFSYSVDGISFQPETTFTGLVPNTYNVVVRNNINGCVSPAVTLTVAVVPNDVFVNPAPALEYCDPNNDGFGQFDLTQVINTVTGGNFYTVSFHETITDAQIDGTSIPAADVTAYENINPNTQTIYIRVESNATACYEIVELQLIVNPTPEATEPADYHACDNDYDGFTIFNLSTIDSEVLGSIDPTTHTVGYYTTLLDAQNGSNPIIGVTNYNSDNQIIYIRVTTTATGCYDIVELQLIVDPLPTSSQPAYAPYSLCETTANGVGYEPFDLLGQVPTILAGQTGVGVTFYPSLLDAQNNTNVIGTPTYVNTEIYVQTLGIRLTNESTGCFVISTMDIRVEPLPTPITPITPPTVCDTDTNGFYEFDLNSYTAEILGGANYIITYHETQIDAQSGANVITENPYQNINPFVQTIWVRAEDPNTGCVQVMPLTLNVNPSPEMPSLSDLTLCDQTGNTQDGITVFDLTVQTPIILAAQTTPASDYTVTYYTTLANAEAQTGNIVNTTTYTNTTNGQTIWVVVKHNTTDCFIIGTFQLNVNAPLLLTTPAPLSVCDSDANVNDQFTAFNLTVRDVMITGGLPGYTVAYYSTWPISPANLIADPTNYTNTAPAVQTLGVVVTSPEGCTSSTTLDIRVLPIPEPNTNPPALAPQCDNNLPGDMLETFDVTVNATYIMNGDPSLTLTYYYTQADAMVPTNPIPNPNAAFVGQNVWIRVENNRVDYTGNNCYVLVEQPLTVNPLPTVEAIGPYRVCDVDTDGIATFELQTQIAALLGASQAPADYTVTFYATQAEAQSGTGALSQTAYDNTTPDTQTIYIRVVNNATGCVNATGTLTLVVEEAAFATGPQTFSSCDDYNDPYDGVYELDLTQYESAILNGQDPAVFLVSYYTSQADADAGTNAIVDPTAYITDADTDQVWVKVINSSNVIIPQCYALTTIDITIERYPNPIIVTANNVNTICVEYGSNIVVRDLLLDSQITGAYTYEWYEDGVLIPGATSSTYLVDTASATGATRTYTVLVISNSALACDTISAGFDVIQSGQASIPAGTIGYTVTNAFADNQIITVNVEGWGTYQYSLDDGPRQVSNIFENVSLGTHTITVWDTEGGLDYSCDELVITNVQTIDYPHYFTPNGDGIHENWNIVGLSGQPSAKIYIFDRFGKLLKQISSTGEGWDGTFNGQALPATDYWFTVDYLEQARTKQFKAHFSLKR